MKTLIWDIPEQNLRVQGLKETLREAKADNVREVFLAGDCDANFIAKVQSLNVPIKIVPSKAILGEKLALDVPCGVVAILKREKQ